MSKAISVNIGKALHEAVYWMKNYRFARVLHPIDKGCAR